MFERYLDNQWWAWVVSNFSISILFGISTAWTLLKILAKLHPDVLTDKIMCLLKGWLYGFPGLKKEDITKEEN